MNVRQRGLGDYLSVAFVQACRERDYAVADHLLHALQIIASREDDPGRLVNRPGRPQKQITRAELTVDLCIIHATLRRKRYEPSKFQASQVKTRSALPSSVE